MRTPKKSWRVSVKKFGSRGDTIVEVLIAITLVGGFLLASYVTATRDTARIRSSQERGEALKIVQGQIEQIRAAHEANGLGAIMGQDGVQFCFNRNGSGLVPAWTPPINPDYNADDFAPYPSACKFDDVLERYHISVRYFAPQNGLYEVRARWDRVGGNGREEVKINYRIPEASVSRVNCSDGLNVQYGEYVGNPQHLYWVIDATSPYTHRANSLSGGPPPYGTLGQIQALAVPLQPCDYLVNVTSSDTAHSGTFPNDGFSKHERARVEGRNDNGTPGNIADDTTTFVTDFTDDFPSWEQYSPTLIQPITVTGITHYLVFEHFCFPNPPGTPSGSGTTEFDPCPFSFFNPISGTFDTNSNSVGGVEIIFNAP